MYRSDEEIHQVCHLSSLVSPSEANEQFAQVRFATANGFQSHSKFHGVEPDSALCLGLCAFNARMSSNAVTGSGCQNDSEIEIARCREFDLMFASKQLHLPGAVDECFAA